MDKKMLHPSIEKFKSFVKSNPEIIKEVRSGHATWQELYEDWYLLGEEDPRWETMGKAPEKEPEKDDSKKDWVSQVTALVRNMDVNQVQNNIHHLSQALAAVQGVIAQFQTQKPPSAPANSEQPRNPFSFRKD